MGVRISLPALSTRATSPGTHASHLGAAAYRAAHPAAMPWCRNLTFDAESGRPHGSGGVDRGRPDHLLRHRLGRFSSRSSSNKGRVRLLVRWLLGQIYERRAWRVRLDRLNALMGTFLGLAPLASGDDLAVGGLEVEPKLAVRTESSSSPAAAAWRPRGRPKAAVSSSRRSSLHLSAHPATDR
jgi:hypothetical protein